MNTFSTLILSGFVLLLSSASTHAQVDTSNFTLTYADIEYQSIEDSILYDPEYFKEYFVEFNINDVANTKMIWIDFAVSGTNQNLLHKCYSKSYLIQNGFLDQGTVTVNLGRYNTDLSYTVTIVLERPNKVLSQAFKKSIGS